MDAADAGTIVLRLIGDGSSLNQTLRQAEAHLRKFAKVAGMQFGNLTGKTLGIADLGLLNKSEKYVDSLKKIGILEKGNGITGEAAIRLRQRAYDRLSKAARYVPEQHLPASASAALAKHNTQFYAQNKAGKFYDTRTGRLVSKATLQAASGIAVQPRGKYSPAVPLGYGSNLPTLKTDAAYYAQQRTMAAARRIVDSPLPDQYRS